MPIDSGTRLGRYEIHSLLGAGGMGEVYRAQDVQLGRAVALKVLPAVFASDLSLRQRFAQEARAVAALNHPNIIAIYDIGVSNDIAYMVTELVEGHSLRQEMKTGAIALRRVLDIGMQVAEGLAAAHEAGIVHRDLKPENVMVTNEGRVKILDFGLAKPTPAGLQKKDEGIVQTEPGMVMGTLSYMSPEQVRADQDLDGRSDQFSLGLVLYEMASGKKAFGRPTPAETMAAILNDDYEPLPASIPPALRWTTQRCLAKDPAERYGSTRDLYLELRNLREHLTEAIAALSGPAVAVHAKKKSSRTSWIALGVSAALMLGLLAGGYWSGRISASTTPAAYKRLTFRRGTVGSGRFTPDGHSVVYSAAWDGAPQKIFLKRIGSPQSGLSETSGMVFAVSGGDMLISPNWQLRDAALGWGNLARTPVLGGTPREILDNVLSADFSPDGSEIAVAHKVGNEVRLEFPIGKPLYTTAGFIGDVRVSAAGDKVAFVDHPIYGDDRGFIAVVDRAGTKTILTQEWASVQGLAWSNNEIWFTAARDGSDRDLYAVDPARQLRLIYRVPGSVTMQDVSTTGQVLLSHGSARQEVAIFTPADAASHDLTWLGQSSPADFSADGKRLLFTEAAEGEGSSYSVWLRTLDGTPPVRLGEGSALALSSDGNWALSVVLASPSRLHALPTGIGEHKLLPGDGTIAYSNAAWWKDGQAVLFTGVDAKMKARIYAQGMDEAKPRAISPEGTRMSGSGLISPDGKFVPALTADHPLELFPLDGGAARAIAGLDPADIPVGWSADGNSLYVTQPGLPAPVFKLNLTTGKRDLWAKLAPSDAAGVSGLYSIRIAKNEKQCTYNVVRVESALYTVDGLK